MLELFVRIGMLTSLVSALLFDSLFHHIIVTLGVWRYAQPLSDFPFQCRRIQDEGLRTCRDLWLADETRTLYMICENTSKHPGSSDVQHTASDVIVALELDKPQNASYSHRTLSIPSQTTPQRLHGLAGLEHGNGASLFLTAIHPNNTSTIEHYLHLHTSPNLAHSHTFASPLISHPQSLAPVDSPIAVFFTNTNHDNSNVFSHLLSTLFPTGSLRLRDTWELACMYIASRLRAPRGLVYAHEGRGAMYVSHALGGGGGISRFTKTRTQGWVQSRRFEVPYAAEYLSLDQAGDVWMVGQASLWSGEETPTVVRMRRDGSVSESGRVWEKVLEDGGGEVLGGVDRVVSDNYSGRLYLSGEGTGLIGCDKT